MLRFYIICSRYSPNLFIDHGWKCTLALAEVSYVSLCLREGELQRAAKAGWGSVPCFKWSMTVAQRPGWLRNQGRFASPLVWLLLILAVSCVRRWKQAARYQVLSFLITQHRFMRVFVLLLLLQVEEGSIPGIFWGKKGYFSSVLQSQTFRPGGEGGDAGCQQQ